MRKLLVGFIAVGFFLSSCYICEAQKDSLNGIEALSFFKAKSQSLIIAFAANIPDTSKVFKKYNLQINLAYINMKAEYEQYRGFMKSCILDNTSVKSLKKCLRSRSISLKSQLDSVQGLIKMAYLEQYKISPHQHDNIDTSVNVSATTPDFITTLLGALADGAVKIWTQINSLNKQLRDTYLSQISSKDYDLAEYNDLIVIKKK